MFATFVNTSVADEVDFLKIKKEIHDFALAFGYVPTEEDFFRLIFREGVDLTTDERGMLWVELINLQRPAVRLEHVKNLLHAKRESIKSFTCEFDVLEKNAKAGYVYVVKLPSFFVEVRRASANGLVDDHQIFSYAGDKLINIVNPNSQLPNARISDIPSSAVGFCPDSPFAQSMLYDTAGFDSAHPGFDFAEYFALFSGVVLFEKRELYEGRECIVLADMGHRFLLDINKDFSLVKRIAYFHHYTDTRDGSKMVKRTLLSERHLRDLSDYGNGIWLPSKIENVHYSQDEEVIARSTIQCTKIEINNVNDDFFEIGNVVPNNSIVFDSTLNMSYMQSDHTSINALLKSVAKSKRVWTFQIISVTLGTLMIIAWFIIQYLAYLKRKNAE